MSGQTTHEFDSSRTCNYCGVAAEQTASGTRGAGDPCPAREAKRQREPTPEKRVAIDPVVVAQETREACARRLDQMHDCPPPGPAAYAAGWRLACRAAANCFRGV